MSSWPRGRRGPAARTREVIFFPESGIYSISISDLNGKLIRQFEMKTKKQQATFKLEDLKAGAYLLNWRGMDQAGAEKLLIIR